jgi:hypothetical protein
LGIWLCLSRLWVAVALCFVSRLLISWLEVFQVRVVKVPSLLEWFLWHSLELGVVAVFFVVFFAWERSLFSACLGWMCHLVSAGVG